MTDERKRRSRNTFYYDRSPKIVTITTVRAIQTAFLLVLLFLLSVTDCTITGTANNKNTNGFSALTTTTRNTMVQADVPTGVDNSKTQSSISASSNNSASSASFSSNSNDSDRDVLGWNYVNRTILIPPPISTLRFNDENEKEDDYLVQVAVRTTIRNNSSAANLDKGKEIEEDANEQQHQQQQQQQQKQQHQFRLLLPPVEWMSSFCRNAGSSMIAATSTKNFSGSSSSSSSSSTDNNDIGQVNDQEESTVAAPLGLLIREVKDCTSIDEMLWLIFELNMYLPLLSSIQYVLVPESVLLLEEKDDDDDLLEEESFNSSSTRSNSSKKNTTNETTTEKKKNYKYKSDDIRIIYIGNDMLDTIQLSIQEVDEEGELNLQSNPHLFEPGNGNWDFWVCLIDNNNHTIYTNDYNYDVYAKFCPSYANKKMDNNESAGLIRSASGTTSASDNNDCVNTPTQTFAFWIFIICIVFLMITAICLLRSYRVHRQFINQLQTEAIEQQQQQELQRRHFPIREDSVGGDPGVLTQDEFDRLPMIQYSPPSLLTTTEESGTWCSQVRVHSHQDEIWKKITDIVAHEVNNSSIVSNNDTRSSHSDTHDAHGSNNDNDSSLTKQVMITRNASTATTVSIASTTSSSAASILINIEDDNKNDTASSSNSNNHSYSDRMMNLDTSIEYSNSDRENGCDDDEEEDERYDVDVHDAVEFSLPSLSLLPPEAEAATTTTTENIAQPLQRNEEAKMISGVIMHDYSHRRMRRQQQHLKRDNCHGDFKRNDNSHGSNRNFPTSASDEEANLTNITTANSSNTVNDEEISSNDASFLRCGCNNDNTTTTMKTLWTTCSICIDEFELNDIIVILPHCKHAYHKDCIKSWLLHKHGNCPLCKTDVVSPIERCGCCRF